MVLLQLGGGVDEEPGAAQLGGHVRQLEGQGLLGGDGLAELNPLLGVLQGGLIGPLGDAQGLGCDADTAAVEGGHGDFEAVTLLAQQVFLGYLHIIKDQLSGRGGADTHLVIVVAKLESLPALLHNEGGDAPGADVRGGDGKDHIGVRLGGVGDEDFAAVEQPVVALVHGGGLGAAGIGAGVGLGEAEGANFFTSGQGHQIFLLLLLGAEGEDRPGAKGHVGGQNHARAAVYPGQLLHGDGVANGIQPRAAVLLGVGDTHQAQLPQFFYGFGRKLIGLIQGEGDGLDLLFGEGADLGAQLFMRLGRLEQHVASSLHIIKSG